MNRYQKLLTDTLVLGLGTFGSKLLVFLLMPLYTALLSPDQYGTAELITTTANLLIPLACVGVTNGMFRFAADNNSDKKQVFSSGVALLAFGFGGFLLLSPFLSLIDYFDGYAYLIVLYVLSADLQAICAQYIRAIDRTKLFSLQGIINTLLTIALNLLFLIVWDMGVTGYVLSVIVGNLLTALFLIIAGKLWRVFSFKSIQKQVLKQMLWFSLPMIPTTVCWLITDLSDRYMVTYFCGSSINGIYSAAYKIPTIVNLISSIFMQAWQFSAVAQSGNEAECRDFYSKVYKGFLSVIMIGAGGLILFSSFLSGLLLNADYRGAEIYMPTLLCAAAFESIVSFFATVYMVRKKTLHSFLTAMLGTVLNVILNLLLIPQMGALGAAVATLISYIAVMVARMIDAPRMIAFRLYLPRMLMSSLLLLLSGGIMTLQIRGGFWWTLSVTALLCILNFPALASTAKSLISFRKET